MRLIFIIIAFTFLSSCKNKLIEECVGTYVVSNESDTILKGRCIKLIVMENKTYVFINECNTIIGTWDMEFNEFIPINFYDPKTQKTHNARYGRNSIYFHNPHLLLNDSKIKRMTLTKEEGNVTKYPHTGAGCAVN